MLLAENLAGIESEGRRLALAARRDPGRDVPQYPGWTLADLVAHTASIHGRTVKICRELPAERVVVPERPEGKDLFDWYDETLDEMLSVLSDTDPSAVCWGFGSSPNVGFWEKRMVIETGVHRWDAYQAFGEEDRLTDLVARSGLEEFPEMWLARVGDVQPLRLIAVDLGESWVFGDADPEAAIEGTVSDLYLRLVSRPSSVDLPPDWAAAVDGLPVPAKG